jgi:hypothetical protein
MDNRMRHGNSSNTRPVTGPLLVKRGSDISFSHFSFQEYLAAAAIAGLTDADQSAVLFERPERLYDPAWLDTIRFLAGILSDHADVRLVQAVSRVLAHPGIREPVEAVSCAALLAAMEEELMTEIPIGPPDTLASLAEAVKTALAEQPFDTWPEPVRLRAGAFAGLHARPRPLCWRQVKGGWFLMGAQSASQNGRGYDEEARPVESPPHRVNVAEFEMLANPVTVEMWGEFMRQGGYKDEKWWTAGGFGRWTVPLNCAVELAKADAPPHAAGHRRQLVRSDGMLPMAPRTASDRGGVGVRGGRPRHRRFPRGDEPPEPSRGALWIPDRRYSAGETLPERPHAGGKYLRHGRERVGMGVRSLRSLLRRRIARSCRSRRRRGTSSSRRILDQPGIVSPQFEPNSLPAGDALLHVRADRLPMCPAMTPRSGH